MYIVDELFHLDDNAYGRFGGGESAQLGHPSTFELDHRGSLFENLNHQRDNRVNSVKGLERRVCEDAYL